MPRSARSGDVCALAAFGHHRGPAKKTKRGRRDDRSIQAAQGKNYNLISVLCQSSDNAESLKTFIQEGDQGLVDFFDGILEDNLRAAQRAKEMLVPRLQSEQE